jgi:HlyD family secretion protein
MKKFLIIASIVVFVGLAAYGGFLAMRANSSKDANADATPVRIEPVTRGDLVELVQAPGEIQPRNKVSISARVVARINELPFVEGATVKKGAVLVRLDDTDLQAALRSAQAHYNAQKAQIAVSEARVAAQKAQLAANRANLLDAQRDLDRQKGLLSSHDVAQSVVDTAQRRLDEQKANLDAAEGNLKADEVNITVLQHNLDAAEAEILRAKDNLSYCQIASPIDGMITRLNAKVGELVMTGTMNNAGTVIMEVADFSEMLLQTRVDEANIASVKVGQKARIHTQAYGDRTFGGTVETVALAQAGSSAGQQISGSAQGRYFKVEILVDSKGERIFAGLTADADVETEHHTKVFKVPSQAVLGRTTDDLPPAIRDGNPLVDRGATQTTVVYRFVDGKAVVTPVKVGPSDLTHTLIQAGLSDSDKIITGPYKALEKLAHDQKVKDEKATTQPATQPVEKATTRGVTAGMDQHQPDSLSSASSAIASSLTPLA